MTVTEDRLKNIDFTDSYAKSKTGYHYQKVEQRADK